MTMLGAATLLCRRLYIGDATASPEAGRWRDVMRDIELALIKATAEQFAGLRRPQLAPDCAGRRCSGAGPRVRSERGARRKVK